LFDIQTLKKYDSQGMHEIYDKWPEIARESYNYNHKEAGYIGIDHIVFAGMGGSGAIGDIFSSILSKENIHVSLVKGYLLPKTADSNTLVVTTSISGDTRETLTVLDSAKKLDCKIIAFSSGGKMQEYCIKNHIEFRKISQMHSPRASFAAFLYTMLRVLDPLFRLEKRDVQESITQLENLGKKISSSHLNDENPSLNLANWINGIPLIYYPWGLQSAAIRFKNSLQENAKLHAITEDVIEACHNGIVSWEKPSSVQPILLRGEEDYVKTKERWEILKEYFKINKIDYFEISSIKGNILSKLINLIYLLDYASIYKAVLSGIDPSPIRSIDYVKSKL
jgi:glucose/mannose-6-phosphate isomerase